MDQTNHRILQQKVLLGFITERGLGQKIEYVRPDCEVSTLMKKSPKKEVFAAQRAEDAPRSQKTAPVFENKYYTELVSKKIATLIGRRDNIMVLEAGCGSTGHIVFPVNTEMTGIDISEEQLRKNQGIKQKISGDIQTYPLPPNTYDAVVCSDVIEHLQFPIKALDNLFQTLRVGGILILAFPNLFSFKGLVSKHTPYWVHVAYYKVMRFSKRPFRTYFRYSIRPNNIKKISVAQGFSIELYVLYGGITTRMKSHRILSTLFRFFVWILNSLTLNKVNFYHSECIMILKKLR